MNESPTWNQIDPQLAKRAKAVLWQMQLISYAPSSAPLSLAPPGPRRRITCPSCRGRGADSCPRCRGRGDVLEAPRHRSTVPHHDSKPPPPSDSLYEDFVGDFAPAIIAGNEERVAELCVDAETEVARYRGEYRAEMELPTDEQAAKERVLAAYEGTQSTEVVRRLASTVTVGWVETVRRRNRRNPQTGTPLDGWKGWNDERRIKEIRARRLRGWNQQTIADSFGITAQALTPYWAHAEPARAA